MPVLSYFNKVLLGTGIIGGTYCYLNLYDNEKRHVSASWTTNYTPSTFAKWDDNWDHRLPTSLLNPKHLKGAKSDNEINETIEKSKPVATRHLILIRHGQYNMDGKKDEERYLTKLGRNQAEFTGKRLKELGIPYTDLVRSTMTRAQETAEIISKSLPDLPIKNCNLIREGAPIPPEPPVGHWKPEVRDGARIEAGFREYFHRADTKQEKDSYTIMVCHANVIRYYVCRALQFPPEAWLRLSLNHASITWITITPTGRVILRCLGDSGHMPPEYITTQ